MKSHLSRRRWMQSGGIASATALLQAAGATPLSAAPVEEPPPDVYTKLGAKPFINCTATITRNGGSRQLPEVIEAIHHAGHYHVNLDQLMESAGKRISELLKVDWAIVTSGAAAALAHATAACVAGTDPERMQQLPDLTGLKNEVIIPKSSRNVYDHAVRMVGVKIVEVDSAEELRDAINHRTAMIAVLGDRFNNNVRLPLKEVGPIAKQAGIPVLVDAAADYLVVPNPYIAQGATLVASSGGKILRGPQTAGLLVGDEKLIRAAFANAAHHHAFGRPMKVSKEEIVGMTTAVDVFINKRDIQAEYREWESWYDYIDREITKVDGVSTTRSGPSRGGPFPVLSIEWNPKKIALTAGEVGELLLNGEPSIGSHAEGDGHSFRLRPVAMKPNEYQVVAERLHSLFRNAPSSADKPKIRPPATDISGRWDVEISFQLGASEHLLFLEADGNDVRGTHFGTVKRGQVEGTIDGNKVRLKTSLPFEGANLSYIFEGRVNGNQMEGSLDLGEYPNGTWKARRHV